MALLGMDRYTEPLRAFEVSRSPWIAIPLEGQACQLDRRPFCHVSHNPVLRGGGSKILGWASPVL